MPADGKILQPAGQESCLIVASAAALETMSDRDVVEDISALYARAVDAGLYAPVAPGTLEDRILTILNYVGHGGLAVDGGKIYSNGAYPVAVPAMVANLRAGLRPYVFCYPEPTGLHAVCVRGIEGENLIVSEQYVAAPDVVSRIMPVDYALANGHSAYAFSVWYPVDDAPAPLEEPPMPEPHPFPVMPIPPWDRDIQTFARWYAEAWNAWRGGENPDSDPRRMESFVAFAETAGKDTTDLSALGAPVWPPPPQPTPDTPVEPVDVIPDPEPPAPVHAFIASKFGVVPQEVADAIAAAWPPELWRSAAELSKLESGWRPDARNNTLSKGPCGTQYFIPGIGNAMTEDSVGLFQVNRCAHGGTVEELSEPFYNARKGYALYQASGWSPWFYSATALGLI